VELIKKYMEKRILCFNINVDGLSTQCAIDYINKIKNDVEEKNRGENIISYFIATNSGETTVQNITHTNNTYDVNDLSYTLEKDLFLKENFTIDSEDSNLYKSNKKLLGVSSGDDKTLYISINNINNDVYIWWRENSGFEQTIFDGVIENDKDFMNLIKMLCIKKLLKIN